MRARKRALFKCRNVSLDGRKKYYDCCKRFAKEVRIYYDKLESKCVESGNVKDFYKYANSRLKHNAGVATLKNKLGNLCVDDTEKSEILNEFFSSVFTRDDGTKPEFRRRVQEDTVLSSVIFTPQKVCKVLRKLPNKTSRRPDGIPALFLKLVSTNACRVRNHCHDNCFCVPLSKLFNVIMQLGDVPDIWCTAEVVPVYKKGDASDPGN